MANDSLFVPLQGDPPDEDPFQGDDLLEGMDALLGACDDDDKPTIDDDDDRSALKLAEDGLEGLQIDAAGYDRDFQQVVLDLKDICEQLRKTVPETHRGHAQFAHLVIQLEGAAFLPPPRRRRINVIGRSGAGKSSLLNSLMCRSGLAKANALGEGCTHVPTAYEGPFIGQTSPFALRIQCFSVSQIRKKLDCMWHDYYLQHFETEGKEDWPEDDKERVRQAAETAFDALRSLFLDRPEFSTEKKAKAFLNKFSTSNEKRKGLIDQLVIWCKAILPTSTEPNKNKDLPGADYRIPTLSIEASTEAELFSQLETYAFSDSSFAKKSLWPLVDVVRLGLKDIRILEHVTLVDWPGVGDTNELRAKASTERVTDCDEVWIVTTLDRVLSEPAVWTSLGRFADSYPCTIVCTQTDLKCEEYEDALRIQTDGVKAEKLKALKKEERGLPTKMKEAERQYDLRETMDRTRYRTAGGKRQKLDEGQLSSNRAALRQLRVDLKSMQARQPEIQHERRQLVVDIHTEYFRQKLQDKIKKVSPKAIASRIFFVSNEHYMGHKGAKDVDAALLTLEGTGIPLLRAHILRQASPGIVANMHHHMTGEIDRVLNGAALTAKPDELENCQGVLKAAAKKRDSGDQMEQVFLATIEEEIPKAIVAPVNQCIKELSEHAEGAAKKRHGWHAMSIKAFVRRDGNWGTATRKAEKWNEEFAGTLGKLFEKHWARYENKKNEAVLDLKTDLTGEMRKVYSIARDVNGKQLDGGCFKGFIDTQVRHLENECDKAKDAHAERVKAIKVDATTVGCDYSTSNFDQAMQDIYHDGRQIFGKGYRRTVINMIAARLAARGMKSPFMKTASHTERDLEDAAREQASAMVEDYRARITDTCEWLRGALDKEGDLSTILGVRQALTEKLKWAQTEFVNCQIRLASVEAKYKEIECEQKRKEMKKAADLDKKGKAKGKAEA